MSSTGSGQQPPYQPPPYQQPSYPQYPPYQQSVVVQQRNGLSCCAITLIVLGVLSLCVIVGLVGVFGLGLFAVNQAANATPVITVGMGQSVKVGSWDVTVEKVQTEKTIDWSGVGNKESAKGQFVEVFVTAKNVTAKTDQVSAFDYELVDGAGARYASCTSFACISYPDRVGRDWFGTQVPPGSSFKLLAIFDVTPGVQGLQLIIEKKARINLGTVK